MEPVAKPTNTRIMLIETWRKISPDCAIGIAVAATLVGGGMTCGLTTKVDRNCQIAKKLVSDRRTRKSGRNRASRPRCFETTARTPAAQANGRRTPLPRLIVALAGTSGHA